MRSPQLRRPANAGTVDVVKIHVNSHLLQRGQISLPPFVDPVVNASLPHRLRRQHAQERMIISQQLRVNPGDNLHGFVVSLGFADFYLFALNLQVDSHFFQNIERRVEKFRVGLLHRHFPAGGRGGHAKRHGFDLVRTQTKPHPAQFFIPGDL